MGLVGERVGDSVGLLVGSLNWVGVAEGASTGFCEGASLGELEGEVVGSSTGL